MPAVRLWQGPDKLIMLLCKPLAWPAMTKWLTQIQSYHQDKVPCYVPSSWDVLSEYATERLNPKPSKNSAVLVLAYIAYDNFYW